MNATPFVSVSHEIKVFLKNDKLPFHHFSHFISQKLIKKLIIEEDYCFSKKSNSKNPLKSCDLSALTFKGLNLFQPCTYFFSN